MTQQKKNFGLAAQLAQPRVAAAPEASPTVTPRDSQAKTDEPSVSVAVEANADALEAEESGRFELSDHTNHTKKRGTKQKKPGAPPREGGYVRRTITLGPTLSDYVDRAWRTYRTPGGKYVKGVSGFIEAVLDEHRRRAK